MEIEGEMIKINYAVYLSLNAAYCMSLYRKDFLSNATPKAKKKFSVLKSVLWLCIACSIGPGLIEIYSGR